MRFNLLHLLAAVTVSAVLLGFATATGHADRDGVWELISIDTVDVDYHSYDGLGPPLRDYVGLLKDGNRILRLRLGDSWGTDSERLPKPGALVEVRSVVPYSRYPKYHNGTWSTSRRKPIFPKLATFVVICLISIFVVSFSMMLQNLIVRVATGTFPRVGDEPDDATEPGW